MCKASLYMKYQSAVEILSILALRGYCLKIPLNNVFVSRLKRARWPPTPLNFYCNLEPTQLEYLCQISLQIYGGLFFQETNWKLMPCNISAWTIFRAIFCATPSQNPVRCPRYAKIVLCNVSVANGFRVHIALKIVSCNMHRKSTLSCLSLRIAPCNITFYSW